MEFCFVRFGGVKG